MVKGSDSKFNIQQHREKLFRKEYEAFESKRMETQQEFMNKYDPGRISHFIPLMYLPYEKGSSKLLVYFHANAEDIVLCSELLEFMRTLLKINVVAVEYPGYGLYTSKK